MNIQDACNEWSDIYDSNTSLTRDLDSIVIRSLFTNRQFESILELGCGTGKNTVFFVEIGPSVHALDFSEGMIKKAKEKVKAANIHFEAADLTERWHCKDDAYDLVSCNLVLEHIGDLSHLFSEAAYKLKTGGTFLVNELHPFRQHRGTQARFEKGEEIIEVEAFVHHISDFIHAAESSGLTLVIGTNTGTQKTEVNRLGWFLSFSRNKFNDIFLTKLLSLGWRIRIKILIAVKRCHPPEGPTCTCARWECRSQWRPGATPSE